MASSTLELPLPSDSKFAFLRNNPIYSGVSDLMQSFHDRRAKFGLSNPGNFDNVGREVQREVFLNNYMFQGIRAELTRAVSMSPIVQVSHQFALGERLNPYTFAAFYGTNSSFLQGTIDNDGNLATRFSYRTTPSSITRANFSIAPGGGGQDMAQFEHEYTGRDFTAHLKAYNPSFLEGGLTGIFIGSYLQSVTPKLALGLETVWQRGGLTQGPDVGVSYVGRYKSNDWIATAALQSQGAINTSYWRRISDKVQAGVDMTLSLSAGGAGGMMGGGLQKDGVTTFGAKYDFTLSTFRAQIDSKGKLSCLLEKRVGGPVMATFGAEVDHFTQQAKIGMGISIETGGEELQEQHQAMGTQPQALNIPF
ncbi:mitochondrial import receptor subunit tom-40 [Coniochaeta ligniaria NRRL 30616]|uniref:Mitochondrial import receptor subunit tom-40 n=1 Tax=Coniochaeta ligniaria NRRL 30616 TaxID=1408157 RepID=A0A1J7IQ13_9PEZI|nr:mitochondrial import receptor subunit tom-40 [Coniochaeta ligniaria NRRL 30616]